MLQVVADVGEERAPRFQLFYPAQAALNGRMRRVRSVAQRIQKQDVQPQKLRLRILRDVAVIRQIGRRSEPEPQYIGPSMQHANRGELQPEQIERLAIQLVQD